MSTNGCDTIMNRCLYTTSQVVGLVADLPLDYYSTNIDEPNTPSCSRRVAGGSCSCVHARGYERAAAKPAVLLLHSCADCSCWLSSQIHQQSSSCCGCTGCSCTQSGPVQQLTTSLHNGLQFPETLAFPVIFLFVSPDHSPALASESRQDSWSRVRLSHQSILKRSIHKRVRSCSTSKVLPSVSIITLRVAAPGAIHHAKRAGGSRRHAWRLWQALYSHFRYK